MAVLEYADGESLRDRRYGVNDIPHFLRNAPVFGDRLRLLRKLAGLTQVQLAERAGLSQPALSDLERNEYEPRWSDVLKLAAALEKTPNDFVHDISAKTPTPPRRPPRKPD